MNKLRLGPLPKAEVVKMAITVPVQLKEDLERYAALHAQLYGEAIDVATMIPHMLDSFIARDRAFRKARRGAK